MQSHDTDHQISVLSRSSDEYKIKTTFLRQTQEIELCIRDKSITKKTPESFTKVCQTHSLHTEWSPPCEDKLGNVTIQTTVPNIPTKAEKTSIVKKNTDNEHTIRKVPFWIMGNKCIQMDQPQILKRKEGLVYTFSIPMESSNQRQYQQAYTVPTTKLKGKP